MNLSNEHTAGNELPEFDKLLDAQDLLLALHISCRTLERWRQKRKIRYYKIGKKIYYTRAELARMLRRHFVE